LLQRIKQDVYHDYIDHRADPAPVPATIASPPESTPVRPRQELAMNSRHPARALSLRTGNATLWRSARFLQTKVAGPALSFVADSFESVLSFTREFADSAREVNRAMDRARNERHTISAHRR
jgi:hypothetical protein